VNTVALVASEQSRPGLRARLFHRGAYQWYAGTIFGLAYQAFSIYYVWALPGSVGFRISATLLLCIFYLGYIALPPLIWPESVRVRVLALTLYWIATIVLVPFIGAYVIWIWPLIVAMIAFTWLPFLPSILLTLAIVAAQVFVAWRADFVNGIIYAPVVTVTVFVSLMAISRQIVANQQLKDAQATIGALAAADERARLARDLHDVLGHSLTVVAVKSELAGRLVELDPAQAVVEIRDIERLARTALADLRAAVTTYREMNLDSELSAARTALDAAGIRAHLPLDGSVVDSTLRPLFSWVLREGVTNVIRHSGATECWVELEPRAMRVRDDGPGPGIAASFGKTAGNGLAGLRERAREAGAELSATAVDSGGFMLSVEKSRA
jgi:two-component system, NarL family, sensor histidine kinase DesK